MCILLILLIVLHLFCQVWYLKRLKSGEKGRSELQADFSLPYKSNIYIVLLFILFLCMWKVTITQRQQMLDTDIV